jgi:hypothetical protein
MTYGQLVRIEVALPPNQLRAELNNDDIFHRSNLVVLATRRINARTEVRFSTMNCLMSATYHQGQYHGSAKRTSLPLILSFALEVGGKITDQ